MSIPWPQVPDRTTVHLHPDPVRPTLDYFECVDCRFPTPFLDRIQRHQADHKKEHSIQERFERWMATGKDESGLVLAYFKVLRAGNRWFTREP